MALHGNVALVCVVASAALHALWNAMLKGTNDPRSAAVGVVAMSAAVTTVAAPFVVPVLFPNTEAVAWTLTSGVFEAVYFITLAEAFRRAPLAMAYTVVRGGAMLLVWPVSILLFREEFTALTLVGASLVAAGLAIAQKQSHVRAKSPLGDNVTDAEGTSDGSQSAQAQAEGTDATSKASAATRASAQPVRLGYAYVCCFAVAGYHLCYDRALTHGMHPFALFDIAMWVSLPITVLALGRAGRRTFVGFMRQHSRRVALVGLVCAVSFLLFLSGLLEAGAGVGITLRNTSVLFAQAMAWGIGERPQRWQLLGAVAVCTGATLVGLSR